MPDKKNSRYNQALSWIAAQYTKRRHQKLTSAIALSPENTHDKKSKPNPMLQFYALYFYLSLCTESDVLRNLVNEVKQVLETQEDNIPSVSFPDPTRQSKHEPEQIAATVETIQSIKQTDLLNTIAYFAKQDEVSLDKILSKNTDVSAPMQYHIRNTVFTTDKERLQAVANAYQANKASQHNLIKWAIKQCIAFFRTHRNLAQALGDFNQVSKEGLDPALMLQALHIYLETNTHSQTLKQQVWSLLQAKFEGNVPKSFKEIGAAYNIDAKTLLKHVAWCAEVDGRRLDFACGSEYVDVKNALQETKKDLIFKKLNQIDSTKPSTSKSSQKSTDHNKAPSFEEDYVSFEDLFAKREEAEKNVYKAIC